MKITIRCKLSVIYYMQAFALGVTGATAIDNLRESAYGLDMAFAALNLVMVGVGAALAMMISASSTNHENFDSRMTASKVGCFLIILAIPIRALFILFIK